MVGSMVEVAGWEKAAHIMAARMQREKEEPGCQVTLSVTCLFQPALPPYSKSALWPA